MRKKYRIYEKANMGQLVVGLKHEMEVRGRMLLISLLRIGYDNAIHISACTGTLGPRSSHKRNVSSAPGFSATRALGHLNTIANHPHMLGCTALTSTSDA
jgi:hypothetical protein